MIDKSWTEEPDKLSKKFRSGVDSFIEMTKNHLIRIKKDKCRCPCKQCLNGNNPVSLDLVKNHLLKYGMAVSYRYTIWSDHGEEDNPAQDQSASSSVNVHHDETTFIGNENEAILEVLRENVESLTSNGKDGGEKTSEADLAIFSALLDEAKQELYPGCKDFTSLTFLVKLMHIKVLNRLSNKSFEMHLELLKKAFPKNNSIPSSYYEAKRMLKGLGLGYESIHACKNDCALFWKEYEKEDKCPVCSESRYKFNDGKGKKIPHKVLRYFPLKPRLQRLFSSKHTARDMRWHKGRHVEDGVLRHPADAEAWKDFDARYPGFAAEPRNVRLGLATDGFNPFGNMSNAYSLWPVVLMPYNLPPFKCMKQPFFMMSLLIPGPQAPGNDIDVYLRPLIDELKELWDVGVETRDVSTGKVFCMRAAVLWTINDFPAYANLSGWSTKGYLACPVCNDDPPSRKLRSKIGYLRHRRFLNPGHTWRDSRLHDGHKEKRDPPEEKTGEQLLQQMQNLGVNRFGKHPSYSTKKRKRSKEELSWTKKSIFYELPYWKHLKIRHKIDVMHVEKNICDNIVGTMLGIDGKNKDTEKARLDLEDMNIRKELHLRPKGDKFEKPPACYTLKPEQRRDFCKFLKSVKFPDGYAANISRCANIADGKIHGLKSHDCHILLQRLLPVGIRAYLRKDVCTAIIELCNFFHDLCAKTLTVSHLDKLEKDIVLILCKLERIFPPAFFDVMVHLAVHLPREAKLVGPVGYSWMYPIERYLGTLKRYVGNKARPEGSIAEAYIINECLTFISMHFTETESKFNRKERNDDELDGSLRRQGTISVFAQKVRPTGATEIKSLSPEERDQIHWYILNNCEEVQPYMKEHLKKLKEETNNDNLLSQRQQKEFPDWFKNRMFDLRSLNSPKATDELYSLALGFELRANSYSACNLNGVRYHTKQREARRTTQNSGLVVDSEFEGKEIEFYGTLCDVIEVEYLNNYRVVLFKCDWFDLTPRKKNLKTDYDLTCLNVSSTWYKNDPYVIASDARQVFYLDDHKFGADWKVVLKMHHRHIWDVPEMDDDDNDEEEEDVYQQTGDVTISSVIQEDNNVGLDELHRDDVEAELVDAEIVRADDIDVDDVDVEEEDETLVNYNDSEVDEEDIEPVDDDTDLED